MINTPVIPGQLYVVKSVPTSASYTSSTELDSLLTAAQKASTIGFTITADGGNVYVTTDDTAASSTNWTAKTTDGGAPIEMALNGADISDVRFIAVSKVAIIFWGYRNS